MMEQVNLRYQQYMDTIGRWGDGLATQEEMQAAISAYEEACLAFSSRLLFASMASADHWQICRISKNRTCFC